MLFGLNAFHVLAGVACLFSSKSRFSLLGALQILTFGWLAGMNFQYTLHYQHDMHHLAGNLIHHAGPGVIEEKGVGGARFGNSVPHGLFPSVLSYQLVIPALICLAHVASSFSFSNALRPMREYIGSAMIISPIKMAIQSRLAHPYLHKENQSLFPYPLSAIIDDYNCHIGQHHEDGTCLGVIDLKPLNELYTFLMKAHASLYSSGTVHRDAWTHSLLNIITDYLLLFLTFLTFYVFFSVAGGLSPIFSPVSVEGDKKKMA